MRVFFSAGEPSGDQHAAHLIAELKRRRPDVVPCGFGGPAMRQQGAQLLYQLTDLAVMGFLRVIPMLRQFVRLVGKARAEFRENPPDVVVLVDFPGFNWWIARAASRAGIPVYYYMPPQLWAWASWRIRRVRKHVDHVLCALPFEYEWYKARGVKTTWVGHPFFDEVAEKNLDETFVAARSTRDQQTLALLPGSRSHEIERNFPMMVRIASQLSQRHPDVRVLVACYNDRQRQACQEIADTESSAPMDFCVDRTSEIIEVADCCLMVSGSVSLELLARGTPGLVVYRIGRVLRLIGPLLVRCRFMSLPNLIADREVMPEFLSSGPERQTVDDVVPVLDSWLSNSQTLAAVRTEMENLGRSAVIVGATGRAADCLLESLPAIQRDAA